MYPWSSEPCRALRAGSAGWLLLLLLCLVPRAFMAWKIGGLCPDAVVYIRLAESFDRGLLHEDKYNRFALNLYPVVLMLLHRSGLDWELAGKLWNVAISCLTVLPLYGWVRRQFDDRVALAAGCLYAMHAELIRWSPEGIRDPTFWFFMMLSLYLLWRATTEVRLALFLLGGLAMAMAVMTRSEGLFLLVPLLFWSFRRGNCAARDPRVEFAYRPGTRQKTRACQVPGARRDECASALRRKRILGVMLAVGVFPALLVLASLFWFRGHAPWELVRTKPLDFVSQWIRACLAWSSGHDATAGTRHLADTAFLLGAGSAASGMRWSQTAGLFASAMFKGMTPMFTLFACIGAAGWWRVWKRGDHQVMIYTVLLFFLAIWIDLDVAQETSSRYFLPVVLVLSPLGALGLLACSEQLIALGGKSPLGIEGSARGVVAAAAAVQRALAGQRDHVRLPPTCRPCRVGPLDRKRVRSLAGAARAWRRDAGRDLLRPRTL